MKRRGVAVSRVRFCRRLGVAVSRVSADKALEGWLMVTKKLLLEMMDIFMFKRKKGGPRPVRSRCRELVTMCYLAWLQRKLAKEAVASASAHTFTHWGVKCGGEEGEAKAAL